MASFDEVDIDASIVGVLLSMAMEESQNPNVLMAAKWLLGEPIGKWDDTATTEAIKVVDLEEQKRKEALKQKREEENRAYEQQIEDMKSSDDFGLF